MSVHLEPGRYLGAPSAPHEVRGFRLLESSYPAGLALPAHSHAHPHFCLVLEGGCTERVGRAGEHERGPCSLSWHPAGLEHGERHHAPGRHFLLEVTVDVEEPLAGERRELDPSAAWLAYRLWTELRLGGRATELEVGAWELLGELQGGGGRAGQRPPRWLAVVDDSLHAEHVRPPRVTELARRAGVHPVHLSRTYRRHRGRSIADTVRALRVEAALRRLASGEESLAEVAAAVGFADQAHLTRSFRALVGVPPGRWRRLLRG